MQGSCRPLPHLHPCSHPRGFFCGRSRGGGSGRHRRVSDICTFKHHQKLCLCNFISIKVSSTPSILTLTFHISTFSFFDISQACCLYSALLTADGTAHFAECLTSIRQLLRPPNGAPTTDPRFDGATLATIFYKLNSVVTLDLARGTGTCTEAGDALRII